MLMAVRVHFARLRGNAFVSAVSMLVGGAASAHAITALALPVVSRLYTPEEFSVLAIFNSIVAVISVAACLRYDIAVAIPDDDADAFNLMALAVGIAGLVAMVVLAITLVFAGPIAERLNHLQMAAFLWLLAPAIFLAAAASALQNWFIRKKAFGRIARSRVFQSLSCVAVQTGAGLRGLGPIGLVSGAMLNTGAAFFYLGSRMLVVRHVMPAFAWQRAKAVAFEYRKFPRFSALEALCNNASIQVPIIMIGAMAVGPEAGYLLLAISAMQAPTALFGVAIGQVYLSHAPEELRNGTLPVFTERTVRLLVKAGIGPLLFAGIVAPRLFGLIFGAGWDRAGTIVAWMTPWFVMQFIASPISMALHVTGNQRAALWLQVAGLLLRTACVAAAAWLGGNRLSEWYAVSGFVMYAAYYRVVMRKLGIDRPLLLLSMRDSWKIIAIWVSAAIVISGAAVVLRPV